MLRYRDEKELHADEIIRANQFIQAIVVDNARWIVEQLLILLPLADRVEMVRLPDEQMEEIAVGVDADDELDGVALLLVRPHQARPVDAVPEHLFGGRSVDSSKVELLLDRIRRVN